MFALSSLAARSLAVGLSAAMHMTVAFAFAPGHGGSAGAAIEVSAIPVDVVRDEEPPPAPPEPAAPAAHEHLAVTHTHPFPVPHHDARPHDSSLRHEAALAEPRRAPEVAGAPAASPARFTMNLGAAAVAHGAALPDAPATAQGGDADEARRLESAVDVPARLASGAAPPYPPAARDGEVEADVPLEIVVDARGVVTAARVTKPAGYGFDDAALRAVRAYRFTPAMHAGRAVSVRMVWRMAFKLR